MKLYWQKGLDNLLSSIGMMYNIGGNYDDYNTNESINRFKT